jgi:hypothetical protein
MEIATDEDRTVRREIARVIVSQSLSLYRALLLARSLARCVALARLRSLSRCVTLGSATSTPARQHGMIWHRLSSMALFPFSGFFFGTKPRKREEESQRIKVC